jgi:hypothetical protein
MKMNGDSHVVAMVDADRPEAISAGQCRKGEGEYATRPYDDTPLVIARADANRPGAIPAGRGGIDL